MKYVDERKLNINRGAEILGKMMANGEGVSSYIIIGETEGVSEEDLEALAKEAIETNPKACEDIRKGKKQAINVLFGYIMKKTRGKADTKLAEEIINKLL